MRPDSFFENGTPLAFNDARYSGLSVGVPGHGPRLGARRCAATARSRSPRRSRPRSGSRATASSSTRRSSTRRRRTSTTSTTCPRPRRCTSTPTARRATSARRFRNPDLARTYELIARAGTRGFYRGPVANAIVDDRAPAADRARRRTTSGGRASWHRRDLRTYDPAAPRPDAASTLPRPRRLRHGPAVERRLDRRRGAEHPRGLRPAARCRATRRCHRVLEASRLAFADRGAYVADPDCTSSSRCAGLLSKEFAATRRALIGAQRGDEPRRAGRPVLRSTAASATGRRGLGRPSTRGGSTTHISVTDRRGNVVSYTFTIESTGGAGLVVPGYGFLLNNELTDFNFDSTDASQPRPGRQAPAQLDEPDDRAARRQAVADRRLARRLDDHHDGAAAAHRPHRPRHDAAAGDRRAAREPAQHAGDGRRAGLHRSRRRRRSLRARGHTFAHAPPRSARRPGSSSATTATCSRRPSRCAAAAAARWSCARHGSSTRVLPARSRSSAARPTPTRSCRAAWT